MKMLFCFTDVKNGEVCANAVISLGYKDVDYSVDYESMLEWYWKMKPKLVYADIPHAIRLLKETKTKWGEHYYMIVNTCSNYMSTQVRSVLEEHGADSFYFGPISIDVFKTLIERAENYSLIKNQVKIVRNAKTNQIMFL